VPGQRQTTAGLPGQLRRSPARHPTLPPQQSSDYQADVSGEICLVRSGRTRCSTQHKQATSRQRLQIPAHQVPKSPTNPVSHHRRTDCLAHHKTNPGRPRIIPAHKQMPGNQRSSRPAASTGSGREVRASAHPGGCRKHHDTSRSSRTEARTPFPAPGRENRTARPGAHAQPEPVSPGPAAVVRLKSTLAH
jgi:hypothetical protein